jgi:hypothetical protein
MKRNLPSIQLHFKMYSLLYLGFFVYVLFFISVAWTGWFDVFFSGAALHVGAKGIDFYQVPRGAWAFWHGGSLIGAPLHDGSQYAKKEFSQNNVYHPLFTLTLGSFLALFDSTLSPYVWLWMKFIVSLATIAYFFWEFREKPFVQFACFIMFINFSIYLELAAWQFQFALNMFLLLFLIRIVKHKPARGNTLLLWLDMLVKPVALLFMPPLVFKGRWRVAVLSLVLFVLSTALFLFHDTSKYYVDNILLNFQYSGTLGPNQIITLAALLHYTTHWPDLVYTTLRYALLLLAVFLGLFRRIHLSKAILLLVAYYLCFYEQVFEYQWSTLAYILAVCIVCCPEFRTVLSRCFILLLCLPSCFVLLNMLHIDVKNLGYLGLIPGPVAWEWMVVSKLVPLFLLLISVFAGDVRPLYNQLKSFFIAMKKVNDHLGVFAEAPYDEQHLVKRVKEELGIVGEDLDTSAP